MPVTPYVPPHSWQGHGPPLLLVAGLGGKGTSWRPFLQDAQKRCSVLTFDNRGAGAAPALDGPVTTADLARDVLALMDHAGIDRVPVIGRSMGGMIAQELALLAPERVSRLCLVATTGRSDAHAASVFELWARMAELGVPREIRHRSSMAWCLGRDAMQNPDLVQPYLRTKSLADRPHDYALQARACASHDALSRLSTLDVPTLVVAGQDDRLTPPAHAYELTAAIPGARLELVPGAGHLVYMEQPETFSRVVMDFIRPIHSQGTQHAQTKEPACPPSTMPW